MSLAGERPPRTELPRQWERLERLVEDAAEGVVYWRRRASEAEVEIARLRDALEEVASAAEPLPGDLTAEIRRVRAENAALQSRLAEARGRVQGVLKRLVALGVEP
jgi:predicted  nucleic acid-binding Zn-ribbon protein